MGLSSLGWPEPLLLDSGNGAQLMYAVNLPVNDENLVSQCLYEIAKASDHQVKIDTTVHNPARIWRIPGTMNCKGDSTPERPHRMAKIISVPEVIDELSKSEIIEIIPIGNSLPEVQYQEKFNLADWIRQYCPDLGQPQDWKGGRRWIFPVCPFNSAHDNKSAVLIEQPSGAIAFTCHHNGCKGNDWRKLRELKEPGCYDLIAVPEVNLGGIVGTAPAAAEKRETLFPNPGHLPENLLVIPSFIEEVMQLTLNTAPSPNRVLAFAGALAFLAFLVGRKVRDKRDNRSNLYLIALADSGTGKDQPRKVNFNLAFHAQKANSIGDAFASGEGLEDALFMHPAMLFQADEFDSIFNNLKFSKDNRAKSINEKLLKLYGASNTIYPIRKKAITKMKNTDQSIEVNHIVNPNLVIFGTAIPKYFYESLSRKVLENGLVARCVIIEAGSRGKAGTARPITPPDALLRAVNYLATLDLGGNLLGEHPKPMTVCESPEVTEELVRIQSYCDEQYEKYQKLGEASAMALWARAFEKICKLAMLHGISCSVYEPVITLKSVKWAWSFVEHLTRRMLFMADSYLYENVFDEKCKKVIRLLNTAGGRMKHGELLKKSHESLDIFKKIIETLMENGTITFDMESSRTKTAKVYVLL